MIKYENKEIMVKDEDNPIILGSTKRNIIDMFILVLEPLFKEVVDGNLAMIKRIAFREFNFPNETNVFFVHETYDFLGNKVTEFGGAIINPKQDYKQLLMDLTQFMLVKVIGDSATKMEFVFEDLHKYQSPFSKMDWGYAGVLNNTPLVTGGEFVNGIGFLIKIPKILSIIEKEYVTKHESVTESV